MINAINTILNQNTKKSVLIFKVSKLRGLYLSTLSTLLNIFKIEMIAVIIPFSINLNPNNIYFITKWMNKPVFVDYSIINNNLLSYFVSKQVYQMFCCYFQI